MTILRDSHLKSIKAKYFEDYHLPLYMWDGLERYLRYGIMPGGFLTAVLENDLVRSVQRADATNSGLLKNWVSFVWMYVPAGAWGSKEQVERWVKEVTKEREEA